jgi:hypothetical protein
MAVRNYTPHAITILREGAPPLVLPSEGNARATTTSCPVLQHPASELGITVVRTAFGAVTGLPEPTPGETIVVSSLVLDHPSVAGRTDLAAPGQVVRGPDGQPVGCRGLRVR